MPFSNNEKSARHRAKVNADPVARARYLAKRRESYQRRKREGKTKLSSVTELSKAKQDELRQKWRHYKRSHRMRIHNLSLHSCSELDVNPEWLQNFAPYSPSSEAEESKEVPVSSCSVVKQEPETVEIQWENVNSPPPAVSSDSEPNNAQSSAISITPPIMEKVPCSVKLTMTKLHCLLESKQEKIEALEKQVQDLQEDRRFLRSQIESLTRALSIHICRGISETTEKS